MSLLSLYTIYFRLESMSVLLNLLLATTTVVGVQCAPRYYRYEDGKADAADAKAAEKAAPAKDAAATTALIKDVLTADALTKAE